MKTEALTKLKAESNFQSQKVKGLSLNSSFAFNILVKAIYAHPLQTSIQEYISNARDAHRRVNKDTSSIVINFPTSASPNFSVRDYGCSISPEKMDDLVLTVGDSDKRANNQETGGYGIGFKSGFAITDSFLCETYYQGQHRLYNLRYNEEGQAICELLTTMPTTEEDGVKVTLPIKGNDVRAAREAIVRAIGSWKVPPKTNLLEHQVRDFFPELTKIVHEDDNVLIVSGLPYNSSLYQYMVNQNDSLVFPILFDEIPNPACFSTNTDVPGLNKKGFPYTRASNLKIFFKASVDDIKQAPSREAFVMTKELYAWYISRCNHVESLFPQIIEDAFNVKGTLEDLRESIFEAANYFSNNGTSLVLEYFNKTYLPKNAVRIQDKYDVKEVLYNTKHDCKLTFVLAHGVVADSSFPFTMHVKDGGTKHVEYTNVINLATSGVLPAVFQNFKPFVYQEVSGDWKDFLYTTDSRPGRINPETYIEEKFSYGGEPVDVAEGFHEEVQLISKMAAPYHPMVTYEPVVPAPPPDDNISERTKKIVTPIETYNGWWTIETYNGWWTNNTFIKRPQGTLIHQEGMSFIIGNRTEMASAPKKYARKKKKIMPYPGNVYIEVFEEDISPEVKKELIEFFRADVISDVTLPEPPKKEKKTTKTVTLTYPTARHQSLGVDTMTVDYQGGDTKDFVDKLHRKVNPLKSIPKIYMFPVKDLKAFAKEAYDIEFTKSEDKLIRNAEGYSRPDQLQQAFLAIKDLLYNQECRFYGIAERCEKLVKEAAALEQTDFEPLDEDEDVHGGEYAEVIWLPDLLNLKKGESCFGTEKRIVNLLEILSKDIVFPVEGKIKVAKTYPKIHLTPYASLEYNKARNFLGDALGTSEMEKIINDYTNHPELSLLSILIANSLFLYPKEMIEKNSNNSNFMNNYYLSKFMKSKVSVMETYDWKVMEGFLKLIEELPLAVRLLMRHGANVPDLTKAEYKELLKKTLTITKIKEVLKEASKFPRYTKNFEIDNDNVRQVLSTHSDNLKERTEYRDAMLKTLRRYITRRPNRDPMLRLKGRVNPYNENKYGEFEIKYCNEREETAATQLINYALFDVFTSPELKSVPVEIKPLKKETKKDLNEYEKLFTPTEPLEEEEDAEKVSDEEFDEDQHDIADEDLGYFEHEYEED